MPKNRNYFLFASAIIVSAIVFMQYGCKHDPEVFSDICFESEVLPIFQNNCTKAGCHNASDAEGDIVLGMTSDELTTLDNFVKALISGDPDNPGIWDLHKNPDTKTRKTRKDLVQLMKEFKSFLQPVLNRMAVSLKITNGDRLVLNIADPVTSRSRQKVQIAEYCYVKTTPMKSGDIRLRFSTTTYANRASLAKGANGVEIAMRIDVPQAKAAESSGETASKVKYLEHADDGTTKVIYTTASFILKLGGENTGNILQFYARWIHSSNPGIAGSWTGPFSSLIP